jgi:hypothetical protein
MKVSHFLKLHRLSYLAGESSVSHCLNYKLNSPHLELNRNWILPELHYIAFAPTAHVENPVLLLHQEYHAEDKSCDSQPVLLECDVMHLHRSVFTEP